MYRGQSYSLDHWGRSHEDNVKYEHFLKELHRGRDNPLDHWSRSTHDNALYAQAKMDIKSREKW